MLVLPVSVSAEQIKLHCDIHYRGLYDSYSVAVDLDTGRVRSTNKHGVSETTQSRSLNPEMIVYNGDSFYVFVIDRTTLSMERTFEINGNYAGQGSCKNVETSDRQI
jgi:hypothetical protein